MVEELKELAGAIIDSTQVRLYYYFFFLFNTKSLRAVHNMSIYLQEKDEDKELDFGSDESEPPLPLTATSRVTIN